MYSVIHKRVFTPPWDLTTRIIEAIDHSSNSTMAFTKNFMSRIFCKCKCHCWVWRMIDSLYYSSWKIPGRCENSCELQNKLPKALLFITKDLNSAIVCLKNPGLRNHPNSFFLLSFQTEEERNLMQVKAHEAELIASKLAEESERRWVSWVFLYGPMLATAWTIVSWQWCQNICHRHSMKTRT